jgi:DNA-binding transcriptional LysR family regulator
MKIDWEDLRLIYEVARQGSIMGAAKVLKVDHSTVTRRLSYVEAALERQLFDRSNRGIKLRPEAHELIDHIKSMDWHASSLSDLLGQATRQTRTVRVAAMEGIASQLLAPRAADLTSGDENIVIELFSNPHIVDILKKEADLFLSFFDPKLEGLDSKKVGEYRVCIYASDKYADRCGLPKTLADLTEHVFVSYIEDMISIGSIRWLNDVVADPKVVFCSNSVIAQSSAAKAGMGLVVLPVFVGDNAPGLFRVLDEEFDLSREVWMSVGRERYYIPAIKTVAMAITRIFEQG